MADKIIYEIKAPVQRKWNPKRGEFDYPPPYQGVVFGVRVLDGLASTQSRKIAIEFADMGYEVTPDPKTPEPVLTTE